MCLSLTSATVRRRAKGESCICSVTYAGVWLVPGQSKELEEARVKKELANIKLKFTAKKAMSSYDRRKYAGAVAAIRRATLTRVCACVSECRYVWKLVYTYMLGYEFDFGHNETINLISAATPNEKQVGYLAAAVLFTSDDESIPLILETMRHDLHSPRDAVQCMALSAMANIGGPELCTALVDDVKQLVMSREPMVRKKAALCMLRILRVKPSLVNVSEWASPLLTLLDDKHGIVSLAVVSFMQGLVDIDPKPFEYAVPHLILHLTRLSKNAVTADYLYYSTANPWLQVRPVPRRSLHWFILTLCCPIYCVFAGAAAALVAVIPCTSGHHPPQPAERSADQDHHPHGGHQERQQEQRGPLHLVRGREPHHQARQR